MENIVPSLEERLDKAEKALERSERMAVASRYASAIMHEVNNPLEAITNLIYLTKLERHDPQQVLDNMTVVEEQLKSLGKVTSKALTFHREQSEAKDHDLVEIAETALKLHSDRLSRHGISVTRRYRGPAMAFVFGSEILQVVSNLLLNAAEVLERGQGRICVSVKSCPNSMHMTITDNGPGIPDRFATRLFEPYLTSKVSGTGLGLWLSSRIIEKHRDTLRFRTSRREGKTGTTFRISLPLATKA
ncbi:sensor histidine kinase [Granulicella sp. L60]|uniref:sensor histidine kinase n=1 Tax=Granulicella sp. L60 TaxID=1641866 RepID=UPI00131B6CC3|nr:HAMP domain-containing sensor histidine kinase [Granulicella sp. L60]